MMYINNILRLMLMLVFDCKLIVNIDVNWKQKHIDNNNNGIGNGKTFKQSILNNDC